MLSLTEDAIVSTVTNDISSKIYQQVCVLMIFTAKTINSNLRYILQNMSMVTQDIHTNNISSYQ